MVLFVWKFPYLTKPTNMHLCLFTCKVERVEMWMTTLIDEYMVIKLEWNAICDKRLSIKMRINVIRSKGMYWSVQWMLACSLFVRFLFLFVFFFFGGGVVELNEIWLSLFLFLVFIWKFLIPFSHKIYDCVLSMF